MDNVAYLIIAILFFSGIFYWILQQRNGGAIWEQYYTEEIAKVIDLAKPGDEIVLDVQKATEVARGNGVASFSDIFSFDNLNNEICVKLNPQRKSCLSYFNNVDVVNAELKLGAPNSLSFKIVAKGGKA